ncbi:MAG: hypothetical protein JWQ43_239 [Glaciihabitans sp.]|nr:hypothetical protein [Glaciihabitans sp.]
MSSIRLFLLDSFARHGELHGHQVRLLAEKEHVHLWTDISVGSLYQAIKRLVGEGLLAEVRVEREGNYPERQIFGITPAGRSALAVLHREGLDTIWMKPDPFDLALARLDPDTLDELPATLDRRLDGLTAMLDDKLEHKDRALRYLSVAEKHALSHNIHRLRSEISWLEGVIAALGEITDDEVRILSDGADALPSTNAEPR